MKNMKVDEHRLYFEIIDTGGMEIYAPLREGYINQSCAFIVVYSVTSRQSYEMAEQFIKEIQQCRGAVPIMMLGNKSDLDLSREIYIDEALEKAKELGVGFYETTAVKSTCMWQAMEELIRWTLGRKVDFKDLFTKIQHGLTGI